MIIIRTIIVQDLANITHPKFMSLRPTELANSDHDNQMVAMVLDCNIKNINLSW